MEMRTFAYSKKGWSVEPMPALDSDHTLVLAFGGSHFASAPEPFLELARAFPTSHILGCSTSGEILDTKLADDSIAVAAVRFEHSRLRRADSSVGICER